MPTGKHRHRTARPVLAAGLLTAALAVAGGAAALGSPALTGRHADSTGAAAGAASGASIDGFGPAADGLPTASAPTTPPATSPSAPATSVPAPTPPTTSRPAPAAPSTTRAVGKIERLENEVTALVNQERAKAGCGPVRTDERLRTASRGHSADMAAKDYFSHTGQDGSSPWDRAKRAGYNEPSGENIAYGYGSAAAVMEGWMSSSGHRANILNCSSKATGVGLAYNSGGTAYWTQLFGRV